MKQVAVIIKHPYRDNDWRVDIYEVSDEMTDINIKCLWALDEARKNIQDLMPK